MSNTTDNLSPSQELAEKIIRRLKTESLLREESTTVIQRKIAEGKMTSSDWKLLFEKTLGLHKKIK